MQEVEHQNNNCTIILPGKVLRHFMLFSLAIHSAPAFSQNGHSNDFDLSQRISTKAYVDLRLQHFEGNNSWLDSGTGHSRFDSNHNGRPLLADFAAEIKFDLKAGSQIVSQVHAYPEQTSGVELTELYWQYRPLRSGKLRSRWRLGMFYPKMSIENRGSVWSSIYGLNYSAINSWLAEELRTIGLEGNWRWTLADASPSSRHKLTASINLAIFGYNDPTGAILSWKGWSNHDRQSGLGTSLPFYPAPGVAATENPQAKRYQPFREIDDRPGFYASFGLSRRKQFKAEVYYYDNQAEDTAFHDGQYAWRTRFLHVSAHYFLQPDLELYGQYIDGDTSMGQGFVLNDFESAYVGLSKTIGPHRLSARFERSIVKDLDFTPMDNNNEAGNSANINYSYYLAPHWKFSAEYQQRRSRQPRRHYRGERTYAKEDQLSFSARYYF